MKFVSLIFVVGLLYWSWKLVHETRPLDQATHIELQEDVMKMISDYIQNNLPTSRGLKFERFWTEKITDQKVKASFVYSFEDLNPDLGEARVQIEGFAILNKLASEESEEEVQSWSFDELHIQNNQIDFKEALIIDPSQPDNDEVED